MGSAVKGIDEEVMVPGLPLTASTHLERNGYPGFDPRREVKDGLVIDRDVAYTLRDGTTCYADIFRLEGADEPMPAILVWSGYGKHLRWWTMPGAEVDAESLSPHTVFECPDPIPLCRNGYV